MSYFKLFAISFHLYEAHGKILNVLTNSDLRNVECIRLALELRRLKSELVLYITSVCTILPIFIAVSILQCHISPRKREQVVIDYSVLHALYTKRYENDFLIAVYLVGILYHLQWFMLAPFRVLNVFYLMFIGQLLHSVLTYS